MPDTIESHLTTLNGSITQAEYQEMYQQSVQNLDLFWATQAEKYITWERKWDHVVTGNFANQNVQWFPGAILNVSANCIDRHLPTRANQPAIIWEGDSPDESKVITYAQLHENVCHFANALKQLGVKRGDRICIYMPMIPEAAIAMLACARIGAIHSVVFAGFSSESLKHRILDASCSIVITADANKRGGKIIPLKTNVDEIIPDCPSVKNTIVVQYTKQPISMMAHDVWYHDVIKNVSNLCPPEPMNATDPLFILYTSGSTGKPKGILHGQGGYLLYATMTFQLVFNYQENDRFWCTADVGWITGHSYIVYGPLASGATTLMFAGIPTYPTSSRCWEIIDKHQVTQFYTAPTAIRLLMREGDNPVKKTSRQSLKVLGTVGEPINRDAWLWYYNTVGEQCCPVVDTWWQTETGGIMITPLPYATPLKPGSATLPFFGVSLAIANDHGDVLEGEASGNLVITKPWPGLCQTIYGDHARFQKTYFSRFPGGYWAGDDAYRDASGYYWIVGRSDDVINASGHRLDTAEIENALGTHPGVAEAAVVGFPHDIKGQGIYAFVTLKSGIQPNALLPNELKQSVRKIIGPIAIPDHIQWTDDLPKTRSGKIMRRILRKIVYRETDQLGDLSTLSNPQVVQNIIENYVSSQIYRKS